MTAVCWVCGVVCTDPQGILHRPDNSRSAVNSAGGCHLGGGSENQGFRSEFTLTTSNNCLL